MSTRSLLLKFAKPYPGLVMLTILLGFSGALFNGVSTALIVPVILRIVGQSVDLKGSPALLQAIMTPFDQVPENYRIGVMAGAIIFTITLKNLATYFSSLVSKTLTRRLTSDIREEGINLLLNIDIDYYAKTKVGDIINLLGGEIGRAATSIGNAIKLFVLIATILVFIGLLLSISWQLTIAATILLSLVTLINQSVVARSRKFGKQLSEMSKAYSISVLETLNGIRLVKTTGNENREYEKLKQLIHEREKADFNSQANSELIGPVSEVMGITSLLFIVFLSKTFFSEQISALSAVLLTYLLVLLRLLPLVSQLNSLRGSFANNSPSVKIISEFLRRDDKPFMRNGNVIYTKLQEGVHFNSVSFAYPGNEKLILKEINLYLPRGTTLALVGGSGAGKSTLAELLPRFYDPTSGNITIDGKDLREFDISSLRKRMGVVSQDTFLFNDSVRNNLAYGVREATEDEIIMAAKRANAYEFIEKLPQGFETIIGDRGVMLSGGQRQRLAIARALLQNPEILILDEATSALDTVSERLVQEALDDLSRDRTTLVIAHRLSTVQNADQIAVLDQGKVVEVGTHEQLLQKGGYYSHLYSMQFSSSSESSEKKSKILSRVSYEIRTQLNSMMGLLGLVLDDLVDHPQERQGLIQESYKSAWRILNTIDICDDIINQQNQGLLVELDEENRSRITNYYQKLNHIFVDIRNCINPLVSCLCNLLDNEVYSSEEQNKLIGQAYEYTTYLLSNLGKLENSING
ncbi:ABC transporter ATP-binding protein [Anabaena sp. 4-3]|uniref:ABC transporter ATP-binding protein n=1 Tax=Anabaena sp. 4-3 TaxID=1811979 RepID=UPI000836E4A9|nr:ABC transporter ATP-binding protein [Anabaena sp. 4-3]